MQEHTSIIIVSFLQFLCAFDRKYPSIHRSINRSIRSIDRSLRGYTHISTCRFVVALIRSYFIIPLCDRVYPSIHPSKSILYTVVALSRIFFSVFVFFFFFFSSSAFFATLLSVFMYLRHSFETIQCNALDAFRN